MESLMEKDGWTVVCESPFEIENVDGSVATGYGAKIIEMSYEEDDLVSQIPIEGILGVLLTSLEGKITPRWLCMNEDAKEDYKAKGQAFIDTYNEEELKAKKSRDEHDLL